MKATRKTSAKKKATVKRQAPRRSNKKSQKAVDTSKELPGYPKYGPGEDITANAREIDVNLDDESLTEVKHGEVPETRKVSKRSEQYSLSKEDLEALGPKDLSMDMGEDEQLKHRKEPVDFAGSDLDVPGSEDDDSMEETGSEDEENNSYSLGGDEKSNLEEGRQ